jgi:preprotein translocase subunit SecD
MLKSPLIRLFLIVVMTVLAGVIALPPTLPINFTVAGKTVAYTVNAPTFDVTLFGKRFQKKFELKQGLDIQGGMQVVLKADMSAIPEVDRETALSSAKEVILRRVDLYGINEPMVQTSRQGDDYRIIVELAGVTDIDQAVQLVGSTAQLEFRLQNFDDAELDASSSAMLLFTGFAPTELDGSKLKRAAVQFDQQTGEPVISIEFNEDGTKLFADITKDNLGKMLGIYLDGSPVALPRIQAIIPNGLAQISGGFSLDEAKQLAIQLNAGALPVPITIIEQRTIGASLGQQSVADSVRAGVIGISLVMIFMILYYGFKGFLASLALMVYAVLTIALYKIMGVTLTLPGIAGLLLSIGMAVDANILIFERMKEELRLGKPFSRAMELGFGRAWDSIKDANLATIMTALILVNPLDFTFLNTSGLVRGFGITLLIGVLISLFTGIVVTRTLMRVFLHGGDE